MTPHRGSRRYASPLQAGVILGFVATGSSFAVSENVAAASLVGTVTGALVYAVTAAEQRRRIRKAVSLAALAPDA
jgi:hypothetical protein